ncbi:MAG: aspartate aminotransferase [Rhizobiales bacterium 24-66-13]|uniref:pyridoxal phosphate-dependent aminotransferase n=1 Tax=Roseixanthobacter finlandensis TaxID=3119922 RepID=UPI000BD217BA|nr:MAG: aspartate aminotransferase [Rhizobiales bacterium 35-66-30]OYZ65577.1 MAG: aspartate aminotransferase [Rhizobiales bacterium 24-66-13]OZA96814.1 MAG: aspartate aminotransferase [Rhizobiales bacterium 39-66-18]HQS08807.1 pyridoxal phosphate-dependent aminotransferase [Xanthobacteraceae bacterium]
MTASAPASAPLPHASGPAADPLLDAVRAHVRALPESGIVEVMNYGRNREGIVPLWAGEGDIQTPAFICEAAAQALHAGETFYTWQRGLPDLRAAIADYIAGLYGVPAEPERFFVTGSGMQAIQIAFAMALGAGDEVLIPSPTWPNAAAAAQKAGAHPVYVPFSYGPEGFALDHARLAEAVTPRTRAIFLNSPANPTGFVAALEDLKAVLALARKHGLWIVADEIYGRFHYGEGVRSPSFHDVMEADDHILFVQTFSKNWAMTGWRIGWIEAPAALGQVIENLIQYSTSGVAAFMQRGAVAALTQGEPFVAAQIARARRGRDLVADALLATGKVDLVKPDGAFYLFFGIAGERDVRKLGLRLVDEANVGLAPGTAFGAGGEGFMRLCYARGEEQLRTAADRLVRWLEARPTGR